MHRRDSGAATHVIPACLIRALKLSVCGWHGLQLEVSVWSLASPRLVVDRSSSAGSSVTSICGIRSFCAPSKRRGRVKERKWLVQAL